MISMRIGSISIPTDKLLLSFISGFNLIIDRISTFAEVDNPWLFLRLSAPPRTFFSPRKLDVSRNQNVFLASILLHPTTVPYLHWMIIVDSAAPRLLQRYFHLPGDHGGSVGYPQTDDPVVV